MLRRRFGYGMLLLTSVVSMGSVLADDVTLTVTPGAAPGDVELEWTGGQPAFRVYRSMDAAAVTSPARQIAETSDRAWADSGTADRLLFYRVTGSVTVESSTIVYAPSAAQALDLYLPRDPPSAPMPLAVLAHGGLWQSGDKSALETLCENIVLESGGTQACASINYRLSQDLGGVCSAPRARRSGSRPNRLPTARTPATACPAGRSDRRSTWRSTPALWESHRREAP